ncbi:c-type cytochrome [Zooshikella harenae]|uniref:Cytochrome c4 n=1 Tax=Zooshikella harenae TaxID=2827238 RepID=A0ABS5ZAA4_9GAMM|nr:cytochrome c4 [Zooshikella harenae]
MKRVLFFSCILMMGVTGLVHATEGDVTAGKAKSAVCSACHGATGISAAPTFPHLAGQGQRYLLKQLVDVKSGARDIPEMTGFVASLSEQDMADIAAFYASQKPPVGATKADKVALGERIYRAGHKDKGIPACTACHSPTGKGNELAGFPHLSGQFADYTAKQLRAFREGERTNDGDSKIMRTIAEKLSNKEVDAVASYVQGLR